MNPYGVNTSDTNIRGPIVSLNILYDNLPQTRGCENCKSINGENFDWCCKSINPSMYYVEFLCVWEQVQKWSKQKRFDLIIRCIRNYFQNTASKGCSFYNNGCLVYNQRPLSCRSYGIIPEDGWKERIEMGKKRFGTEYNPPEQCKLVSTVDGISVTKEMEDNWFLHTRECEKRIGVPKSSIQSHDGDNGSYRSFHDHLLIELFNDKFLSRLTKIRLSINPEQIDKFIEEIKTSVLSAI